MLSTVFSVIFTFTLYNSVIATNSSDELVPMEQFPQKVELTNAEKVKAILKGNYDEFEIVNAKLHHLHLIFLDFIDKDLIDRIVSEVNQKYKQFADIQYTDLYAFDEALCCIVANNLKSKGYTLKTGLHDLTIAYSGYFHYFILEKMVDIYLPIYKRSDLNQTALYVLQIGSDKELALIVKGRAR